MSDTLTSNPQRDLHGLCNRLAEVFNEDDTPDELSTEAREAIEELWQERDRLRDQSHWYKQTVECSKEIDRLREALLDLYNGTAEYVYLNNLGDPHNTTPMRQAAEVLGVEYPRSLGAKNLRQPSETDARQPVLTQKDVNFCERHQDAFRADEPCPKCTSDTS